jgi:hypothetical protein
MNIPKSTLLILPGWPTCLFLNEWARVYAYYSLHFQIIVRLTFFTTSLTTRIIQKKIMQT